MKKLHIGFGVAVLVIITLFALSKVQRTDIAQNQSILRVGLNTWIGNGIYYVAQEKGFFEKENIKVEFVHYDDGAVGKQLLVNGSIDVLDLTPETAIVLADSGADIKVIAALDTSEGADGIIVTEGINTLSDLKGKKIAFETGSPSHLFLSYLLDKEGLSTADLNVVNMPAPDTGSAFLSGSVEAAVTWEPWLSKAVERPGGKILVTTKEAPVVPNLVMVKRSAVQDQSDEFKSMLRALFATEKYIQNNSQESYEIMAKNLDITVDDVVNQIPTFRWFDYADNVNGLTQGLSSVSDTINEASKLWYRLGLIKNSVAAEDLVDDSIIKNLYQ